MDRSAARADKTPFQQLPLFRWYGKSVNSLLPVAQVGSDLLHAHTNVPGPTAFGIVDIATTVYAQMAFAALGLVGLAVLI